MGKGRGWYGESKRHSEAAKKGRSASQLSRRHERKTHQVLSNPNYSIGLMRKRQKQIDKAFLKGMKGK